MRPAPVTLTPVQKLVAQAIDVLTFTFWTWGGVRAPPPPPPRLNSLVLIFPIPLLDPIQAQHISLQNNKPDLGRPRPTNISRYTHHAVVPEQSSASVCFSLSLWIIPNLPIDKGCPVLHSNMASDSTDKYEVLEKIGTHWPAVATASPPCAGAINRAGVDVTLLTPSLAQAMAPLESSERCAGRTTTWSSAARRSATSRCHRRRGNSSMPSSPSSPPSATRTSLDTTAGSTSRPHRTSTSTWSTAGTATSGASSATCRPRASTRKRRSSGASSHSSSRPSTGATTASTPRRSAKTSWGWAPLRSPRLHQAA